MSPHPPAGRVGLLTAIPALLAPAAAGLGFLFGGRLLLPVLATLAIYPCFALLIVRGRRNAAIAAALLWAASLSVTTILLTVRDPARAGAAILNGDAYRDEMFAFIADGKGRESDPAAFVPLHARHLSLFVLLSAISAGLLGLGMGTVLVGYMSYYVGALAGGPAPLPAALFGWPPWAVVRVVGFIILGTLLSRPLLSRLVRRPIPAEGEGRLYLLAFALLVLDLLLKWLLAPYWPALLRPCLPG
ncbi:MAG TPA: hypothetical protein VFB95_10630 [Candidatus Cryosericum sp.]|nr:hypothetical protein [Candidatus Cryosericum sp.]